MDFVRIYDSGMQLLAVLDNADAVGYTLVHNDLWTGSFAMPNDDPKNKYCQPGNYVQIPDGPRKTGLYRISGIPSANLTGMGEATAYEVEHVLATLLDDVVFGKIDLTGKTPQEALETLLAMQTVPRWVLGDVEYTEPLGEAAAENETLLSAIQHLCEQLPEDYAWAFETEAMPWVLHIRHADTDDQCGIYYGRNLTGIVKTMDAAQIVTRLYLAGGADSKTGKLVRVGEINDGLDYIDADTMDTWGVRSAIYGNGDIETPEELLAKGWQVLESYKNPYYTYQATALDLYRVTGFEWDNYMPGKQVRVMDYENDVLFSARIVTIEKPDVFGDPGGIVITIANRPRDELNTVTELVKKVGSMGGGGGGGGMNGAMKQQEYELRKVINYAQLDVDSANAFIKAVAGVKTLDEFQKGKYNTVSEVSLSLDGQASVIAAKADRIELNGLVTATAFQTEQADIRQLLADEIAAEAARVDKLFSDLGSLDTILATSVTATNINATGTFSATNVGCMAVTISGSSCTVQTLTIGGKSCSFVAPASATFELSDMPGYEAAMAAAESRGAASVHVSNVYPIVYAYNSGERAYAIRVGVELAPGGTSENVITVPADRAYDNGYEKGVQDGREAGYDDGYQDGLDDATVDPTDKGYQDGFAKGRQDGYTAGYQAGKDEGYAKGLAEGKDKQDYQSGWVDGYNRGNAVFQRSGRSVIGPAKTSAYGSEPTRSYTANINGGGAPGFQKASCTVGATRHTSSFYSLKVDGYVTFIQATQDPYTAPYLTWS